ncbi:TorF family putative porin [Draconibacterium sp.]|nr:TorF family putative porin [Draconibacterium sp.]
MKKTLLITACLLLFTAFTPSLKAQEWNAGLDIYSSYIWRGLKFGTGVAFQPSVEFSAGGFAVGAWGSFSSGGDEAAEADLYASYGFDLGESSSLSFTLTDYYFPGSAYFESESHFIEPMVSLGLGSFSLSAAYMLYEGAGNGDDAGDIYLEAGLSLGPVDLTLGGGNGQYSMEKEDEDDKFAISNIGIGTSKEIKITESFSLPVSGSVILNPSTEQFYVVVGISL